MFTSWRITNRHKLVDTAIKTVKLTPSSFNNHNSIQFVYAA